MNNPVLDHEKRQRFSQRILERLNYLERQVNDMLIFAKDGRMAMETFSLAELLNHLRETVKESTAGDEIDLQIINQAKSDVMLGNENALRGALLNLLNNAIDAVGQVGCIEIAVNQIDDLKLRIEIKDDGAGIDQALCQRVFEPFFTTKAHGTGLGLAVVDSVVKAHGGDVQVRSAPACGTVFSLILPCINQEFSGLPSGLSHQAILPDALRVNANLLQAGLSHQAIVPDVLRVDANLFQTDVSGKNHHQINNQQEIRHETV
jgi:two-component system sensor histidine kinase FlrB